MESSIVPVFSAIWFGILTSISPCPLATNIAAISFVGRRVDRPDYVFLTPTTYDTDYVAITAPLGSTVSLDGNPVTLSAAGIGSSGYSLTTLVLQDGVHVIEASDPIGVMVYAYGGPDPPNGSTRNVSYGYPAGLDLKAINPVE